LFCDASDGVIEGVVRNLVKGRMTETIRLWFLFTSRLICLRTTYREPRIFTSIKMFSAGAIYLFMVLLGVSIASF